MPETLPQTEGRIPFKGHSTWYTIVGEGEEPGKAPLLLLHGGPGGAHDYMESMGELARGGRRVIMYDQLGCGKSPVPSNPDMWTVELFVEEVDVVRQALGLERLHILGQSWGGMLGMEYALTQPEGVVSLIICDSPGRMDLWVEEANRLRADLPPEVEATLRRHEEAGTTDDPAYMEACQVFYARHVCRLDPMPPEVVAAFEWIERDPTVYHTMNGPSEFHVVGSIRDWQSKDRLGEIQVPKLLVSGRHDEAAPALQETLQQGIAGSEWVVFEDSSQMAHVEERERFMHVVGDWLARHD